MQGLKRVQLDRKGRGIAGRRCKEPSILRLANYDIRIIWRVVDEGVLEQVFDDEGELGVALLVLQQLFEHVREDTLLSLVAVAVVRVLARQAVVSLKDFLRCV